jgi:hypothetical protein
MLTVPAVLVIFPYVPGSYQITIREDFHLISHFINVSINPFMVMYLCGQGTFSDKEFLNYQKSFCADFI